MGTYVMYCGKHNDINNHTGKCFTIALRYNYGAIKMVTMDIEDKQLPSCTGSRNSLQNPYGD